MPIKVLHVVTYMGRGGLETMLMNYYRNIDRSKIQFDFLVHRDFEADYDAEIRKLGGKIYHLPRMNPFSPRYLSKLDAFFKTHKEYHIVHSHVDCMAGIPLKYAKRNGVPIRIAHSHNSSQPKNIKYLLKLYFKKDIPRYANRFFACGKEAGEWMFGSKVKFHVLRNAIDADKYCFNNNVRCRIREELGIAQETFVVGHVGRFASQKNHELLIDIFEKVVQKNPDSKLLLVGEGDLRNEIESKCIRKNIYDKVIFMGICTDVPELLQAMDVFVFPSRFEGLSLAIIEAQAAGLPCIMSDSVSDECIKTIGLVEQLSLEDSLDKWCGSILKKKYFQRRNTYNEIESSGYDIVSNAKKLEQYYMKQERKYGAGVL